MPLLFGADKFWHPLAGVIAGGIFGATLLALLFCPVVYLLVYKSEAEK
jgi:multidrug efflux pump subunit AcrB